MKENLESLKNVEKKIYLAYNKDGIWDIALGLFLLIDGILMTFSSSSYMGIVAALMIPIVVSLKKRITLTRFGFLKFSEERKVKENNKKIIVGIILTITFCTGIFLFYKFITNSNSAEFPLDARTLLGLAIALILAVVTLFFGIYRFLYYSILIVLIFSMGKISGLIIEPEISFILFGLIITISGFIFLIKFIKDYPKQENESGQGDYFGG